LEFPSFDNLLPISNSSLEAEFLHGGVLLSPLLDTLVIEQILLGLPITNPHALVVLCSKQRLVYDCW
jgi:hypothetical protein